MTPLIAARLPFVGTRHAQELIEGGGVTGKIVLVHNECLSHQESRLEDNDDAHDFK